MDKKGLRRCGEKWRVSSLDRKCLKGPEAKHQFIRAIYTNQRRQKTSEKWLRLGHIIFVSGNGRYKVLQTRPIDAWCHKRLRRLPCWRRACK